MIRSGFGLCGGYNNYHPDEPPNPYRRESTNEHAGGCVELARSLQIFCPRLLPATLFPRMEHLLADHDLGENSYGDAPDDGSQNRLEKDAAELQEFIRIAQYLPADARQIAIEDFKCFQDPLNPNYPLDISHMVQLAKAIDKAEAVLSAAVRESLGVRLDLHYKSTHFSALTTQDQHFIAEAQNDSTILASWLAHYTMSYHRYYGFAALLAVIKAAVTEIRGAWFPWFDDFCTRNQIPATNLTPPQFLDSL